CLRRRLSFCIKNRRRRKSLRKRMRSIIAGSTNSEEDKDEIPGHLRTSSVWNIQARQDGTDPVDRAGGRGIISARGSAAAAGLSETADEGCLPHDRRSAGHRTGQPCPGGREGLSSLYIESGSAVVEASAPADRQ